MVMDDMKSRHEDRSNNPGLLSIAVAAGIVIVNLALAVFNLIPIPPLDGSKILFALIPYRYHSIEEVLTRYQFFFALLALTIIAPLLMPIVSFLFRLGTGL